MFNFIISTSSPAASTGQVATVEPLWLALFLPLTILIVWLIVEYRRRRQYQNKLVKLENNFRHTLTANQCEAWDWHIDGQHFYRTDNTGLFPNPPSQVEKESIPMLMAGVHPNDINNLTQAIQLHMRESSSHFEAKYRIQSRSGKWIWVHDSGKIYHRDEQGHPTKMSGTIRLFDNEAALEEEVSIYKHAINCVHEGLFILDSRFRFRKTNPIFNQITGYDGKQLIGKHFYLKEYPLSFTQALIKDCRKNPNWHCEVEIINPKTDQKIELQLTISKLENHLKETCNFIGVVEDISSQRKNELELRRLTNTDLLTGLANRNNLIVTLTNLTSQQSPHALLIINIDDFKEFNDNHGHEVGDNLLKLVASFLKNMADEHTWIYRTGGDEFAMLMSLANSDNRHLYMAQAICECFSQPLVVERFSVFLNISVGVALYPDDAISVHALLRKANIAMHHAKKIEGSHYQYFSESLNDRARAQLNMVNMVHEAIEQDYFELQYQPQIDTKLNKVCGIEALVRLNHPKFGFIPPNQFIEICENKGMIVQLGTIILRKAVSFTKILINEHNFDGKMSINLSPKQFLNHEFVQEVDMICRELEVPPSALEFEITESAFFESADEGISQLNRLSKLGIELALDDFGTGYSSLSYLQSFPLTRIKIDKSFVDDAPYNQRKITMLSAIVNLARNLTFDVIVEGVETQKQLELLNALQCYTVQGFLFSKPLAEEDLIQFIQRFNGADK